MWKYWISIFPFINSFNGVGCMLLGKVKGHERAAIEKVDQDGYSRLFLYEKVNMLFIHFKCRVRLNRDET